MKGQWIGQVQMGTSSATAQIDIDERRGGHEGSITLTYSPEFPVFVIVFFSAAREGSLRIERVPVNAYEFGTANAVSVETLRSRFEGWSFSSEVSASFELLPNGDLQATWTSDDPEQGGERTSTVLGSKASNDSTLVPVAEVGSWSEFKSYIDKQTPGRFVYRGQNRSRWRLRTAFHRAGRYNMYRFLSGEMAQAQTALAPHLRRTFDLDDPVQNASFIHLLQHHGYPTPFLDWSKSPFVAAYFAFQMRRNQPDEREPVRIHMFDGNAWQAHHAREASIIYTLPTLSIVLPNAIDNPRSRPQQSVSIATNVDDLENFIEAREKATGVNFLTTIDLPYSERTLALRDLLTMNITAESLFPGLQGTCEALSIENFDLDTL